MDAQGFLAALTPAVTDAAELTITQDVPMGVQNRDR